MTVTEAPTFPVDPQDVAWGVPAFPEWVTTFRDHQITAMLDIYAHYDNGADVVILDAPTGSGKTLIAEGERRLLGVHKTLYCPDTKTLQDQFVNDYGEYAKLLKGRSNYPTFDNPEAFNSRFQSISAADCLKKKVELPACGGCDRVSEEKVMHCRLCHPWFQCPYEFAKREALDAELAVLNTSYFLAEVNGPGMFAKRDLCIIDEADTLENALMNQVEVVFTAARRTQLNIDFPEKKTVAESWIEWVNLEAIPKIGNALVGSDNLLERGNATTEELRWNKYLNSQSGKLYKLREALEAGNAVYDGYEKGEIRFLPVNVAPFAPDMLWKHADKWLLMSATIIDPQEFVDSLGIEKAGLKWEIVRVPSTFPAERRPIHVRNAANMVWKEKEQEWPKMAAMVKKVLKEKHPTDRVLIHTVSYEFSQYIFDALRTSGRNVLVYSSAKERQGVLDTFKKVDAGVLIAPSMDRGIDLPDDLCRAVIVCKCPFPSLKDKRVQARMYSRGGQSWFAVQVIRKLVQMTGRGMRSAEDYCDIYILDAQFTNNVFKKNKTLFPVWWRESLDWSGFGL